MGRFRFLLIIAALFASAHFAYASTPWCDSHVQVKAIKNDGTTGGGLVYATREASKQSIAYCINTVHNETLLGKSHDASIFPCDLYLAAKPDEGYELEYWECTQKMGSQNNSGTAIGEYYDWGLLPPVQKAGVSKMKGNPNNGDDTDNVSSSGDINAIWIAHFKPAGTQTVKVKSENESLGTAIIDKVTNTINSEVTLSAWCGNRSSNPRSEAILFLGWFRFNEITGEKEYVTRENPYTFTISEENKGTYYARFASGYSFWRIKNKKHKNYLTAVAKYTGQSVSLANLQTALQTQLSLNNSLSTSITDAGTMMKVWISGHQPKTNKEVWDIYVQNEHTNQYYPENLVEEGTFLQVIHNKDNTYYIQGNKGTAFLKEPNYGTIEASPMAPESADWCLEGMDKDLTTKENYFAVDPSEFIGPDNEGNYWTTLRVCFNMKYETSEITPYIVTAADASTGEMTITEVTGGIIPEKTCVLLKCKSTDVTRNVMIPTTTTASFSPAGNLLQSSTYYYKNQAVASNLNLKGIKLVDGRIGFGKGRNDNNDPLTTVDGNRAYLSITNDVAVIPPYISITLANLCQNGHINGKYVIEESLLAVYGQDNKLWLKDTDGSSISKTEPAEGDKNYEIVTANNTRPNQADYDQSNWLEVQLPSNDDATIFNGRMIKANAIKGVFTNKTNPTMTGVQLADSDISDETHYSTIDYAPNYYCTANFEGSQNGTTGNTTAHYFLMNPKPQEYAKIMWAQYAGNNKMVMPSTGNGHGFTGEFNIDLSLNPAYTPVKNDVYNFTAIIHKTGSKSNNYLVFPLDLNENVITAVTDVTAKQVASVKYYNLAGIESDQPHQGVNIVVTTYTDGSRTSAKVLR